ncbi:MAG TPA: hypothetical protein VF834_24695 [Streptosporangiaceae bacterium]
MRSLAPRRIAVAVTALSAAAALGIGTPLAAAAPASTPGWRIFRLVSQDRYRNLLGLVANGPQDAWAFGDGPKAPIAVRWNGSTWTGSLMPGANARPEQVSSTGHRNVWASGHRCYGGPPDPPGNSAYVARWNGSRWSTTSIKSMPFCSGSVVTTGPGNGWLFGTASTALHLTAHSIQKVSLGHIVQVVASAAVSAKDVWAFGYSTSGSRGVTLHWNGSTWRSVPLPKLSLSAGEYLTFMGAVAVSSSDVWATAVAAPGPLTSVLLHWNGTAWHRIVVPSTDDLYKITTDGHGGVWILGYNRSASTYTFLHDSAGKWTMYPIPTNGISTPYPSSIIFNIYTIAHIPGTTSVWATGDVAYPDKQGIEHGNAVFFKYGP